MGGNRGVVARRVVRLMEFQEVLRSSIPVEEVEELKTCEILWAEREYWVSMALLYPGSRS